MDKPSSITLPEYDIRLAAFKKEAKVLLNIGEEESCVPESATMLERRDAFQAAREAHRVVVALDLLVRQYAFRMDIYCRETTAKSEKRYARKIQTHADALAKLLEGAPARVIDEIGSWLAGLQRGHSEEQPEEILPDIFWRSSDPTMLDTAIAYTLLIGHCARGFAGAPSPKPATTPQRWLLRRAMTIATGRGMTLEDGVQLAGMAHWAVFGEKPQENEWGEFEKNHFQSR